MAFKPDRPLSHFNISHLNPETVRFAILLREGPPKEGNDDWKKDLTEEEIKILEEENLKKKAERKIKPCVVKDCKDTERNVQLFTIERVQLLKKIADTTAALGVLEEDTSQLNKANEQVEAEAIQLTEELAKCRNKEKKELKEKLVTATRTKQQLELAILKANAELSKFKEEAKAEADIAAREKNAQQQQRQHSNLPPVNFQIEHVPLHGHKHTGTYRAIATGFKQWSCCLADDEDAEGCSDEQSIGVRSTLVRKTECAHHPYTQRLHEHEVDIRAKSARLHQPSLCPPVMNKGFRDARPGHIGLNKSQESSPTRSRGPEAFQVAPERSKPFDNTNSQTDAGSFSGSHKSEVSTSKFSPIRGSTQAEGPFLDMKSGKLDNAQASIVHLESSLLQTASFLEEKRRGHPERPSTAGAFPLTGSMRVGQKRVTSGPFPVFASVDLAMVYNPAVDPGMVASDLRNAGIDSNFQCLDSASLLANYNRSVGMPAVGQQRHLGLAQLRRHGGRPLTAQSGPHLKTSSTIGKATSLAHFCQKQC